jgi:hypothetical protein
LNGLAQEGDSAADSPVPAQAAAEPSAEAPSPEPLPAEPPPPEKAPPPSLWQRLLLVRRRLDAKQVEIKRGLEVIRALALVGVIVGATYYFGSFVTKHYPIREWIFWRYARAWGMCIFFSAASLSLGNLCVTKIFRSALPLAEHVATSVGVGVFVFYVSMFVGGVLHLYGPTFFFALPAMMLGAGASALWRRGKRMLRHVRAQRRLGARPASPWAWAATVFGLAGLAMVYFVILTPNNVAFDARWQHLAIAEQYAVERAVSPSPEGWYIATSPHLASYLYCWAFLMPKAMLFDRIELAAHIEFTLFAWSLVGISALVRRLVPHLKPRAAWAARFLFPGVMLYDSSLGCGADHVSAFWAVLIYLALLRAWKRLDVRHCVLLSLMLAGGIQTKYSSAVLLLPIPALVIGVRMLVLAVAAIRGKLTPAERQAMWAGPVAAVVTGLLFTAPHWLKNWIWYGDPLYPVLHARLTLHPWTPDSANLFENGYKGQFWKPNKDMEGLVASLKTLYTFSFIPNDWRKFHGKVPTFGSLFTLLIACLPFLPKTRRIWGLVLTAHVAIFAWYWTHHQDRYLQTILPWMAAVTAAIIVMAWQTHVLVRGAIVALVALQIIWGGDVYFIATHAMTKSPVDDVVRLLGQGYKREYDQRFNTFDTYAQVGRAVPRGSRVLLHEIRTHTGIGVSSVNDITGWQGGISYGRQSGPNEMHALMQRLGVTHIVWDTNTSRSWDSLAGDMMFFDFATRRAINQRTLGRMTMVEVPPEPPGDDDFVDTVAFLGCGKKTYPNGLYKLQDMRVPSVGPQRYPRPRVPGPPRGATAEDLVASAAFVVVDPKCQSIPAEHKPDFTLVAKREGYEIVKKTGLEIYLRTEGQAIPLDDEGEPQDTDTGPPSETQEAAPQLSPGIDEPP